MRPSLSGAAALLVLLFGLNALGVWRAAPLERLELALYDLRLNLLAGREPDPRIVLVDIDARALAAQGRWPWPRERLAELLDRLGEDHAPRLIALDMVLAEPERNGATRRVSGTDELSAGDRRLAASLARWPMVLGYILSDDLGGPSVGQLPTPVLAAAEAARGGALHGHARYAGNLPELQQAAGLAGHLNAYVDADGVLRRLPLLLHAPDGSVQAALSLVMLQRLLAAPGQQAAALRLPAPSRLAFGLPAAPTGPAWIEVGQGQTPLHIALGPHAEALPPFSKAEQPFAHWSAADVMAGQVPAQALRDKLVIVGVNAPGLVDRRMTPTSEATQGSVIHASMLSALLSGQARVVPPSAPLIEAGSLALLALIMVPGLRRLSMLGGAVLTLAVLLGVAALNAAAWQWAHWALPLASLLLLPPLLLAVHLVLSYGRATRARHRLAALFGQYVPPELVDEMSRHAERYTMAPRDAELSVLFADVQGFSRIANRLPAAELSAMMNLLFLHLTDVVRAHRGTLDKYIGDAVMAFWGAPLEDPQHQRHAVDAALAMRERLPRINADLAEHGWPPVDLHIGVNSGHMVVGDMGSRHRRAYTVLGDAVNVAARLQTLCSGHALGVVVGEATARAVQSHVWCLPLGAVAIRGRDASEQAWVMPPRSPHSPSSRSEVDRITALWLAMREAADGGDIDRARALLDRIDAVWPGFAACAWQRDQLAASQVEAGS